jgi:hypothetical protein
MPTNAMDRVIGIALSNPKFRKQLLAPNIDNESLFKRYGIKATPELLKLDKTRLVKAIESRLDLVAWCGYNVCGGGA